MLATGAKDKDETDALFEAGMDRLGNKYAHVRVGGKLTLKVAKAVTDEKVKADPKKLSSGRVAHDVDPVTAKAFLVGKGGGFKRSKQFDPSDLPQSDDDDDHGDIGGESVSVAGTQAESPEKGSHVESLATD